MTEQGGKVVIRNVTLINAKELNMTMLEYTTYDGVESAAMVAWLLAHGYRKSVSNVNGKTMTFFRSQKASTRFYEDKGKLSDGSDFNSSSFVLEY